MEYDDIMYIFPPALDRIMSRIDGIVKDTAYEIRIRCGLPIVIKSSAGTYFVGKNAQLLKSVSDKCAITERDEMDEVFSRLCEFSLYSHENTIKNGYIVMRNGCRAGICGNFSDSTYNLRSISSVNIRIAHQVKDCDKNIAELIGTSPLSVLIAGSPGCGKTTVLRELCKRYSDMLFCVSILDERGEIAAASSGRPFFNVGACTDIISYRSKREAAQMALKYMCPDIIAFDELTDDDGILKGCAAAGAKIFSTIHAENLEGAFLRMKVLNISSGYFDLIAVLSDGRNGSVSEFWKRKCAQYV